MYIAVGVELAGAARQTFMSPEQQAKFSFVKYRDEVESQQHLQNQP